MLKWCEMYLPDSPPQKKKKKLNLTTRLKSTFIPLFNKTPFLLKYFIQLLVYIVFCVIHHYFRSIHLMHPVLLSV